MPLDDRSTKKEQKDEVQKYNSLFLKTHNFKLIETTSYQLGSLGRLIYT